MGFQEGYIWDGNLMKLVCQMIRTICAWIEIVVGRGKLYYRRAIGKRVFKINDENKVNLALPKMDFAEAIYTERDEMKNIDFSEFHLVFDIIKQIIEENIIS